MPEPSLIDSYLAGMRRMLRVSPGEADRIIEEAEDHLTQAVLEGVESGLSLQDAEERAIARFGLPREVCSTFNRVYRPWYRRWWTRLLVVATALASLPFTAHAMSLLPGLIPVVMGLLPAYYRRNVRAGIIPGLAACAVSGPFWLWFALVNPGWYRDPAQRPPLGDMGVEISTDLLMMALLLLQVAMGAFLGACLGRRRDARLA